MTKKLMDLQRVTAGAWAVLAVLIASCAAIVIWAPGHFWESLAKADWRHVAGVITLIGGAFIGLRVQWKREIEGGPGLSLAKPWERPGFDDEAPTDPAGPRAFDRRDRPPGDRGSSALAALLALGVAAGLGALLTGCGANTYRVQYEALGVAAELTAGASEVVYASTAAAIHERCAPSLETGAFRACAENVGAEWRPAQTAIGTLRLGLGGWFEGLRIAEVHGAEPGPLVLQSAAAFVRSYVEATELLAPHGHELPPIPDLIVAAARGLEVE